MWGHSQALQAVYKARRALHVALVSVREVAESFELLVILCGNTSFFEVFISFAAKLHDPAFIGIFAFGF